MFQNFVVTGYLKDHQLWGEGSFIQRAVRRSMRILVEPLCRFSIAIEVAFLPMKSRPTWLTVTQSSACKRIMALAS